MEKAAKLWGYVGRFSLVHLITYTAVGIAFLSFQGVLPAADRVALEFYESYRPLGLMWRC